MSYPTMDLLHRRAEERDVTPIGKYLFLGLVNWHRFKRSECL